MPDWRDPTDPRGMRATRAPRGRGGGGLPPSLPTIRTLLAALTAVVLAFVIGRATGGGGGGESEVSATPSSVSTTTTAPKLETHTVGQGESLSSIAASYGLTTEELASFNGITNVNHVFVGQRLSIPTAVQPTLATTTTKAKAK
jgi:LysM repeat protein